MRAYRDIVREIKERNVAEVPFPLKRSELEAAAHSFICFLSLPQKKKNGFHFKLDPNNRGSNIGYLRKHRENGDLDEKEYFHYNEFAEREFTRMHSFNITTANFFEDARKVYDAAKETLSDILGQFETEYPGIRGKFFPADELPHFYLRFLKYSTAGRGNFLAKGHYDRGASTLAIAESAPGLRIGKDSDTLKEITHRDGAALFFPASNFHIVTSHEFPPSWHDVVQKSEDCYRHDIARWAIVFFADYKGMPNISFEDAHTPR